MTIVLNSQIILQTSFPFSRATEYKVLRRIQGTKTNTRNKDEYKVLRRIQGIRRIQGTKTNTRNKTNTMR